MKFKRLITLLEKNYKGKLQHQPRDPNKYPNEVCRGDNIFTLGIAPKDLYTNYKEYLNTDSVHDHEVKKFMKFLMSNKNNPKATLKIYRGQPSKYLNYGMWVTPFKTYALNYAYDGAYTSENAKVYEYTVKLHDISCDLDSLAEWGYFGKRLTGHEINLMELDNEIQE